MSRTQRLFRIIWRINALLILGASALAVLGLGGLWASQFAWHTRRDQIEAAKPPVGDARTDVRLALGHWTRIDGTSTFQAPLLLDQQPGTGFSSSYDASETRNLLFVDAATGAARWLLDSDDEVIVETEEVRHEARGERQGPLMVTVVLVKPPADDLERTDGRLLVFDPTARRIEQVASGVRALHAATPASAKGFTLVYERERKYVVAAFDAVSLARMSEQIVAVPPLK